MKTRNSIILESVVFAFGFLVSGCGTTQNHTLTSPYHPGPVVGQKLGTGVGVAAGNVAGAAVGFSEGVVKGTAAPFNNRHASCGAGALRPRPTAARSRCPKTSSWMRMGGQ